ncbi:CD63 antigen-like [Octopus vulgaris]|uniref:Tetraspanin n=1 Tax=Octopus vulgaris TaxID=6645 RepID=A0AA36BQ65_OCTVU|nr:CD63 antigen-like [Octopus vulgaris]
MVEAGMKCIKYLLFAFNFIFVIAAIALIAVGIVVQTNFSGYLNFFDAPVTSVAILLIVVGVIMFFIAAFGCCGAIKEHNVCTMVFAVLLALIFILQLAGGIAAFVMRSDLEKTVTETMTKAEQNYLTSPGVKKTWDDVQTDFKCCGVEKSSEWQKVYTNTTLPDSCCKSDKGCDESSKDKYQIGCADAFISWSKSNLAKIAAAGLALAFIQVIGIVFACCLAQAIRKEYECV